MMPLLSPPMEGCRGRYNTAMRRKILPYNPKLKPLAKAFRNDMTISEILLWNELKQKKMLGYDFDLQLPIYNFIVDFYCKDLMLAIEVDGISHDFEEVIDNDEIRQKKLENVGVRFLRFDDREIRKDMPNVLRTIEYWIEEHEKNQDNNRDYGKVAGTAQIIRAEFFRKNITKFSLPMPFNLVPNRFSITGRENQTKVEQFLGMVSRIFDFDGPDKIPGAFSAGMGQRQKQHATGEIPAEGINRFLGNLKLP